MPVFTIKGRDVLIDEIDIPLLNAHAWYWLPQGYLVTSITVSKGKRRTIGFHRLALGDPSSEAIDHINRDKADNRRFNLRPCTDGQNAMNRDPLGRGVTFNKKRGKWQVVLRNNGKLQWLGYYKTEAEAQEVSESFYKQYQHNSFRFTA